MANPKQQLEALGRMDADAFHQSDKLMLVLVLDNIRSGLNVGSLFRTSDAYRVQEIRLCGITAQPPQKDIKKTALGATDSVAWSYWETTAAALDDLRANGYRVAAIEQAEHTHMLSIPPRGGSAPACRHRLVRHLTRQNASSGASKKRCGWSPT